MFLTHEEVVDLTGYEWKCKQAIELSRQNYPFQIRTKDGFILVLRSLVEERLGGKSSTKQEKVYQPNYAALSA